MLHRPDRISTRAGTDIKALAVDKLASYTEKWRKPLKSLPHPTLQSVAH